MEKTKKTFSYQMDVVRYTPDEFSFFYENSGGYSALYVVDSDEWKPTETEKVPPKEIAVMFAVNCKDEAAAEVIKAQLMAAKKIELGYDGEEDENSSNVREVLFVDNVDWSDRLLQMA
jgi:hypothetical protein